MKKCPNCQKSYDNDGLKFCQTDGTPLVVVAEQAEDDPYKTIVGNQADISSIIAEQDKETVESDELPADPFQTLVAPPPQKNEPEISDDEDILDIGDGDDDVDLMKTMVVSGNTIDNIKISVPEEKATDDSPTSSSDASQFADRSENVFPNPTPQTDAEVPSFQDVPSAEKQTPFADEPQFGQTSNQDFSEDESPFDKTSSSIPIQSPFDQSMPPGYAPPSTPPFEPPKEALKPEALNEPQDNPPMSPFAEPEINSIDNSGDSWSSMDAQNSPIEDQQINSNAPINDWGNNQVTPNSPSDINSPPATEGQNMTLAYVSLATGVLSMTFCCWIGIIMGPAGIVTGFLARKKIAENPSQYGGDKFALIGMITGVVGLIIWIGLTIFNLFLGGLNSLT